MVNSGVMPTYKNSYPVSSLPSSTTLFASIYTQLNGNWSTYQDISFTTAAPALK